MKVSIVIAVLDSWEVVRRQILHFKRMELDPANYELIIVDDGSTPPLKMGLPLDFTSAIPGLYIIQSHDPRPWSQPCARNLGAEFATGEYLLMTDIDHVLSKEAILVAGEGGYDKMDFPRHWAVLTKDGEICQDKEVLFLYGLPEKLYEERGLHGGHHSNTFAMRADIFARLGGYDPRYCGRYGGDDVDFSKRYSHLCRKLGEVKPSVEGPPIYVYPDPRRDVKEVFHDTRRVRGSVNRIDPICPACDLVYNHCFCNYPKPLD